VGGFFKQLHSCCPEIPILLDLLRRQEKDGVSCKKRSTITNRNHFHVRGIFTRFALWKIVSQEKLWQGQIALLPQSRENRDSQKRLEVNFSA